MVSEFGNDYVRIYTMGMPLWVPSFKLVESIHHGNWKLPFYKTWVYSKKTFKKIKYWRKPFEPNMVSHGRAMAVEGKWK